MKSFKYILLLSIFTYACKKEETIAISNDDEVITLAVPKGFPYPELPQDNKPTKNRIMLGEKLFFDPILSRDSTISCGSCHHTDKFFTDGLKVSKGINNLEGIRNSPTLLNIAYQPYFFWDGGVPTLEQQVIAPIESHVEMDFDVNLAVERLKKIPEYVALSNKAYKQDLSPFVLTRAIACYERTLFTKTTKYDDYLYNNNSNALNESETNGMNIFFGEKGECFHCHNGYNFTDNSFKNNGLYLNYVDSGRARITLKQNDAGKFKVPSLRNVEYTAPYMHDGSISTLEEVIEHYNNGGKAHPNKSGLIKPLNLTEQEKQDLITFLKTLTDK